MKKNGRKYIIPAGAEFLGFIKSDLLFYDARVELYGTSTTSYSYHYDGPSIVCCIPAEVVSSVAPAAPAPAAPAPAAPAPAYAGKKRGRKKSIVFETVFA